MRREDLTGEPELRLAAVARQSRPFRTGRRGDSPSRPCRCGPSVVHERLGEHPDAPLLTEALDRAGQESPLRLTKSPAFSAAIPRYICETGIRELAKPS